MVANQLTSIKFDSKMVAFNKAGLKDLLKIQGIAHETWPNTFGQIIPPDQLKYMLDLIYSERSLEEQMMHKGHNFILVEEGNRPLGFTSYEFSFNSSPQLMIHKIYLLPSAQGMGIGTKLLDLLSDLAKNSNNNLLRLKVYYKNNKAIGFYEKYGFKNVGTETTDIGHGYIILDNVMVKAL